MKNIERYFDEIYKELENYGIACAVDRVKSGRESTCTKLECECLGCYKDALKWLNSESTLLSKQEYEILKNIPKKWKYIARDEECNDYHSLNIYTDIPEQDEHEWLNHDGEYMHFKLYEDLFKFITWESRIIWCIPEMLKEYEARNYGR